MALQLVVALVVGERDAAIGTFEYSLAAFALQVAGKAAAIIEKKSLFTASDGVLQSICKLGGDAFRGHFPWLNFVHVDYRNVELRTATMPPW